MLRWPKMCGTLEHCHFKSMDINVSEQAKFIYTVLFKAKVIKCLVGRGNERGRQTRQKRQHIKKQKVQRRFFLIVCLRQSFSIQTMYNPKVQCQLHLWSQPRSTRSHPWSSDPAALSCSPRSSCTHSGCTRSCSESRRFCSLIGSLYVRALFKLFEANTLNCLRLKQCKQLKHLH